MSDRLRTYRCLVCPERPLFSGKLEAHLHVARWHSHELAGHHIDEFIEGIRLLPTVDIPGADDENIQPPFVCLHCDMKVMTVRSLLDTQEPPGSGSFHRGHLTTAHNVTKPVYGHDFISELDIQLSKQRAKEAEEALLQRSLASLHSFRGVADFLTECDAGLAE